MPWMLSHRAFVTKTKTEARGLGVENVELLLKTHAAYTVYEEAGKRDLSVPEWRV